jgi:hypothetical protein
MEGVAAAVAIAAVAALLGGQVAGAKALAYEILTVETAQPIAEAAEAVALPS